MTEPSSPTRWIVVLLTIVWTLAIAVTAIFALLPGADGGRGGTVWHVAAFVSLGLLTRTLFRRRSIVALWAALIAFGGAIEIAQGTIHTGRDENWGDFVVDILATSIGLAIAHIALDILRRWRHRNAARPEPARGSDAPN